MASLPVSTDVVSIRNDQPKASDSFLVDTNVWFWLLHSHNTISPSQARNYQLHFYPTYLSQAKKIGASLYYTTISIIELYRVVESAAYRFYLYKNNLETKDLSRKDFRYNYPSERQSLLNHYDSIYTNIKEWATHLPRNEHDDVGYINELHDNLLNGMLELGDHVMLKAMGKAGISSVITDDGDFCTTEGITVFSANKSMIKAAKGTSYLTDR